MLWLAEASRLGDARATELMRGEETSDDPLLLCSAEPCDEPDSSELDLVPYRTGALTEADRPIEIPELRAEHVLMAEPDWVMLEQLKEDGSFKSHAQR